MKIGKRQSEIVCREKEDKPRFQLKTKRIREPSRFFENNAIVGNAGKYR